MLYGISNVFLRSKRFSCSGQMSSSFRRCADVKSVCSNMWPPRPGAEDFEDIENYGIQKEEFLRSFLQLPNGIPSHDTIDRVFRHLDPVSLSSSLQRWSSELLEFLSFYQINIDGKVLRGTAEAGKRTSGICLVSAWVADQGLSLGQVKVDEKSNEKIAIPKLLDDLDLENAVVSIDAVACNPSIAEQIVEKQGDYLLALKKNQKKLYEQVTSEMERRKSTLEHHLWEDFGSGPHGMDALKREVVIFCKTYSF